MRNKLRIYIILSILLSIPFIPALVSADAEQQTEIDQTASFKEQKMEEGFILDLKTLVEKSKKKIEKVDQKLKEQAMMRRNMQREEKARGYYQKALRLFEENKYDQARELWEKAITITEHPEMKDYIHLSVKKTKKKIKALDQAEQERIKQLERERGYKIEQAEKEYRTAINLYKKQKYAEAMERFELVEEMFPDYKGAQSYLRLIELQIQEEQKKTIALKIKEEAKEQKKKKEEWRQEIAAKEKQRLDEKKEKVTGLYNEAVKLYKLRQYETAKEKFKEIEWLMPDYRATRKYLKKIKRVLARPPQKQEIKKDIVIDKEIEEAIVQRYEEKQQILTKTRKEIDQKKRLKEEAEFLYKAAQNLYKKKDYIGAHAKFQEVHKLYPYYKKSEKYIKKLEQIIVKRQRDERETSLVEHKQEEKPPNLEPKQDVALKEDQDQALKLLYDSATSLYKNKHYVMALERFREIEATDADYKATPKYIAKLDRIINSEVKVKKTKKRKLTNKEKKELEQQYQAGMEFYHQRNYAMARSQFDKIQKVDPDYKATQEFIQQISVAEKAPLALKPPVSVPESTALYGTKVNQMIQERQELQLKQAEIRYKAALALYETMKYEQAKEKFIKLEAFYPGYKDTLNYLARIDEDIARVVVLPPKKKEMIQIDSKEWEPSVFEEKLKAKQIIDEKTKKLESLYKEGIALYKQRRYEEAQQKFIEVDLVQSDYQSTQKYLKRIVSRIRRQKIAEEKEKQQAEKRKEQEKIRLARKKAEEMKKAEKRKQLEAERAKKTKRQAKESQPEKTVVQPIPPPKKADFVDVKDKAMTEQHKKQEEEKLARQKIKLALEQDKIKQQELERLKRKQEAERKKREKEEKKLEALKRKELKRKQRAAELAKQKEEKKLKRLEKIKKKEEEEKRKAQLALEKKRAKELEQKQKKQISKSALKVLPAKAEIPVREESKAETRVRKQQKQIDEMLSQERKKEKINWKKQTHAVYKEAVRLYKEGDYVTARMKFLSVEGMHPGYKSTRSYLNKAEDEIALQRSHQYYPNEKKKRAYEFNQKLIVQELQSEDAYRTKDEKEQLDNWLLKEKQLEQERLEADKRFAERRKQEMKTQEMVRREEEKLKREKERREKIQRAKDISRLKGKIKKVYRSAFQLYEQEKYELAENQFYQLDRLLARDILERKYSDSIRKNIEKDKERIKLKIEKRRKANVEKLLAAEKQETLTLKAAEEQRQKMEELLALEEKIKKEEHKIAEEKRLLEKEIKLKKIANANDLLDTSFDEECYTDETALKKKISRKREELEACVKEIDQRAQAIDDTSVDYKVNKKKMRLKLVTDRDNFDEKINQAYYAAIKAYKHGAYHQSKRMFLEIQRLQPNYKSTIKYLNKIERIFKNQNEEYRKAREQNYELYKQEYKPNQSKSSREHAITSALDIYEEKL